MKNQIKKVTYTIPEEVINGLDKEVEKGSQSLFVADAIKEKIAKKKLNNSMRNIDQLFDEIEKLRPQLPKLSRKTILNDIKKGRKE